jgi:AcrR family transcriptional regulator
MPKNAILASAEPAESEPVTGTIAQQALARREAQYATEVRRLLDAGLDVMRTCGTASSPRVSDIVAAAGLSNDAFYRHFASKEALVAAILDDGSTRLSSYLEHQMAKASTPAQKVRRFVEGVMAQAADDEIAATTLAVLWNGGSLSERLGSANRPSPAAALAPLLREPFVQLGSAHPETDATLAAHAAVGTLSDFLWQRVRPPRAEIARITEFCLAAVTARPTAAKPRAARRTTPRTPRRD